MAKDPLTRRRKKLEKELSSVRDNLRDLEARTGAGERPPEHTGDDSGRAEGSPKAEEQVVQELSKRYRDERFANYLASSFGSPSRPLRHERRVQRNRAIIMVVFVVMMLIWLISRLMG